ncbi:13283_t:CDS:2, partial [Racocetra persica]
MQLQNNIVDRLDVRVNSSENIVNRLNLVVNQCINTNSKLLTDNTKEINHSLVNITTCEKQSTIYTDITNSGDTSKQIENKQSSLEQNTDLQKMQTPKIDIHPLIQELKMDSSEEVYVKTVNIDKNSTGNQSSAIKLVHLFERICFAEFNTIRAKQEEIAKDKILRIKIYSTNKLSKLTDTQIDTIIYEVSRITKKCGTNLPLREKISCSYMTDSEPSHNQDSDISKIQ